ncbi:hypothetical protein LINGRAHAP2_LOCUS648 [Linum grandiflorum]
MGKFRMVDLESDVFLAIFDDSTNDFHALTGGPWIILGHYLVVFSWEPTFRVSDDLPSRMVVWIRFPRLPYQYYNRDILLGLGNLVGSIVRPDDRTLNSVRGKFARIAVEMDLSVPAPKGVFVDGHWQVIEYENLPCFCKDCGRFGHEASNCDSRLGVVSPVSTARVSTVVVPCAAVITGDVPAEPEWPWQMVSRKHRRAKKASLPHSISSAQSKEEVKGRNNQGISKVIGKDGSFLIKNSTAGKKYNGTKIPKGRTDKVNKNGVGPSGSGLSSKQKEQTRSGGSIVKQNHVRSVSSIQAQKTS